LAAQIQIGSSRSSAIRLISSTNNNLASTSNTKLPSTPIRSKQLIDEAIPHKLVCLVDPATGGLLPSSPLQNLLHTLDRTRFTIHLVDPSHDPPICRIIDKKEQYTKQQAKKALNASGLTSSGAIKGSSAPPREVQLTWGVSSHDLGHKLNKAKELLQKGFRVQVIISPKKGADSIDAKGKARVIESVKLAIDEFGILAKPTENKGVQVILEFKKRENS
jgi:translation initiation factor IF-3